MAHAGRRRARVVAPTCARALRWGEPQDRAWVQCAEKRLLLAKLVLSSTLGAGVTPTLLARLRPEAPHGTFWDAELPDTKDGLDGAAVALHAAQIRLCFAFVCNGDLCPASVREPMCAGAALLFSRIVPHICMEDDHMLAFWLKRTQVRPRPPSAAPPALAPGPRRARHISPCGRAYTVRARVLFLYPILVRALTSYALRTAPATHVCAQVGGSIGSINIMQVRPWPCCRVDRH